MPFILPANTLSAGGYDVDNSLRFNVGSSDYLNRTVGSAGNRKTFTFSSWIKKNTLTATSVIIAQEYGDWTGSGVLTQLRMDDIGRLQFNNLSGNAYASKLATNALNTDQSAWYHFVAVHDSSNSTELDRMQLWINGVRQTDFDSPSYPALNYESAFGTTEQDLTIGATNHGASPANFFNGYMSEVCFIDGQALAADSFGEFDEDSGIWKPIDVSGLTFGTNGFYLETKQSGTSANASGLGADTSGNDNHFAVNNLTAVDQSTDTCTNNFCTWNAIAAPYSAPTLSEGNLKVTNNAANWQGAIGTFGISQGKWFWEARFDNTTNTYNHGVIDESVNFSAVNPMNATGYTGFYNADGGEMKKDATDTTADYGTFSANNIIGIALNMDDKQISIYKNGDSHVANFALSTTSTLVFPCTVYYTGGICSYNFGNAPFTISSGNTDANDYGNFEYAVPSGYYALNTKNLAEFG